MHYLIYYLVGYLCIFVLYKYLPIGKPVIYLKYKLHVQLKFINNILDDIPTKIEEVGNVVQGPA